MFSSAFSKAFASGERSYIAPQQAQKAILAGAVGVLEVDGLVIGGRLLISLAGRPMRFQSDETAARYCELLAIRGASELGLIANLPATAKAVWLPKKVASLRAYSDKAYSAAARQQGAIRAALIDEAHGADMRADEIDSDL